MDVLIKDLELPKTCDDCLLCLECEYEAFDYCRPLEATTTRGKKRNDCPLVELPPHGELIDEDGFRQVFYEEMRKHRGDEPTMTLLRELLWKLDNAPVIVEATEAQTAPPTPIKREHCRYYAFSAEAILGEHEYCIKKGTFNFECSKQCPYVEIIEVIPKMTNYERIKNMTIDEMAEEICNTHIDCNECEFNKICESECNGAMKWLESEASTEGEESK